MDVDPPPNPPTSAAAQDESSTNAATEVVSGLVSASAASSSSSSSSTTTTTTTTTALSQSSNVLPSSAFPELPIELTYSLVLSWRGGKYDLLITSSDTVGDLKMILWSLTQVPPQRQKILGLVKGKLPDDSVEVAGLGLVSVSGGVGVGGGKKVKEFMMVGTPEGEEHKEIGPATGESSSEADVDYSASQIQQFKDTQKRRNARKLKEAADNLKVDLMNEPREGKKLIVLDLDHCIFDTGLWREGSNFTAEHFARPYLHQFLKAVSPYYDIVIWSQTSWRWLETKLVELHIIGDDKKGDYNIIFVCDRTPMFSVYSERDGKAFKHEVKALGIIWSKFAQYTKENTIHVDDLSRNFAMNPKSGLKVHAYKDSLFNQATDKELVYVTRYLLQLVKEDDFTKRDHKKFRECGDSLPEGVEDPFEWEGVGLGGKKRKAESVEEQGEGEGGAGASGSGV